MVVGNRVIIDGKEVVLDSDDTFYATQPEPFPSLSSSPSTTTSLPPASTSTHTDIINNGIEPTNTNHITNEELIPNTNAINNDEYTNHTSLSHPPTNDNIPPSPSLLSLNRPPLSPPHPHIVHDNTASDKDGDQGEEIPEEIRGEEQIENENASTFSFHVEADTSQDTF